MNECWLGRCLVGWVARCLFGPLNGWVNVLVRWVGKQRQSESESERERESERKGG